MAGKVALGGSGRGRTEGRAKGSAETVTALIEAGRTEGNREFEELIARIAKEKGICLNGE